MFAGLLQIARADVFNTETLNSAKTRILFDTEVLTQLKSSETFMKQIV